MAGAASCCGFAAQPVGGYVESTKPAEKFVVVTSDGERFNFDSRDDARKLRAVKGGAIFTQ